MSRLVCVYENGVSIKNLLMRNQCAYHMDSLLHQLYLWTACFVYVLHLLWSRPLHLHCQNLQPT